MSYQVLARKWRPQTFATTVGQQHVLQALTNALEQGRLHHAYLFTGTRGIGKTTIARLLAKALNCEQGVSATPCGQCSACKEIETGSFVDLIEVDAASRTKVEDTRELLDNVQYAPTRGRYKVYLIDEVHMLSGHSFNALLKTLEEPPEHVKFLLCTTDPQKLPITVLSRCLQFHLKALSSEQIAQHLKEILTEEKIQFEDAALAQLARVANGSLRDSLSLLEQAIAYCQSELNLTGVNDMLGIVEQDAITPLLEALASQDGAQLLTQAQVISEKTTSFAQVLEELASTLHHLCIAQLVPDAISQHQTNSETIQQFTNRFSPEEIQLYYQIAITGKRDLTLAPDPRTGFEMTLLRLLAFHPATTSVAQQPQTKATPPPQTTAKTTAQPKVTPATPKAAPSNDWQTIVSQLNLNGMVKLLANNCSLTRQEDNRIQLQLANEHASFLNERSKTRLNEALTNYFGKPIHLTIETCDQVTDSPLQQNEATAQRKQKEAFQAISQDAGMRELVQTFDANLSIDSVKPAD